MQNGINIKEKLSRDFKAPESFMRFCLNILHDVHKSSMYLRIYVVHWNFGLEHKYTNAHNFFANALILIKVGSSILGCE